MSTLSSPSADHGDDWREIDTRWSEVVLFVKHINVRDRMPAPPGWVAYKVDGYGNEVPGEAFSVIAWATADRVETLIEDDGVRRAVEYGVAATIVAGQRGPFVIEDGGSVGRVRYEDGEPVLEWLARTRRTVVHEDAR